LTINGHFYSVPPVTSHNAGLRATVGFNFGSISFETSPLSKTCFETSPPL